MGRFVQGMLVLLAGHLYADVSRAGENAAPVNYMLHCQGCHLPGGVGHPGIVPNMRNQVGLFLRSDDGRAFLVQVPGVAQSSLDDAELAALMNWMLPAFDPVNVAPDFAQFTAAEIGKYRQIPMTGLSERRRRLLSVER